MASLHNTLYHFESSGLAGMKIDPVSVRWFEALSEPYGAELELEIGDPNADPSLMLGQDCVLWIDRREGELRRLCGIVRAVTEGALSGETTRARVVVVPGLWFLSRRRDTRIFQDMTVQEILADVLGQALGDYGRAIEDQLDGTYPKREYCVQYAETDLDFCHRLMEEEGIFYTFDHDAEQEKMVLYDTNPSCPELVSTAGDALVPFSASNAQMATEPVHLVHKSHKHSTTSVVVNDWDWTRGDTMPFDAEKRATDQLDRDRESYEHGEGDALTRHSYSGRAFSANDATRKAELRAEAHAVDVERIHGVGRVTAFLPGVRFQLTDHPVLGMDGEYLVTRVMHANGPAETTIGGGGDQSTDPYHNVFECIPVDTAFRPARRTHKPTIGGVQTAVVTGPSGEEIHVDEHGRIKVQFHWDRIGKRNENSSCWVRVEQAWALGGWGFWWVPRIGMEVVVHFVDGDPDRPFVTGCVYNGTNPTPYELPGEKTKSTIKSDSSIGAGFSGQGFNEFRFEDLAGSEEIYTHAEKDYNEVVENDHNTLVHHDQTNTVDNDQTQIIGHDQIETVNVDQKMTVGNDRTVHVKGNFDETVDGTETRAVTGDVTETFDANETRTILGNVDEAIGVDETRTITGNQDESITANQSRTITGASSVTITGPLEQTVVGGMSSTTPAAHNILAVAGYTVKTPASITMTAPGGIVIIAPGGVTHVDNSDSWMGQLYQSIGIFGFEAFAIKTEAAAISIGFTKFKVEVGHTACCQDQLFFNTIGARLANRPIALMKRLKLDVSGFKNQG